MRYATLMRILSARNGGVFVGLPEGQARRCGGGNRECKNYRAAAAALVPHRPVSLHVDELETRAQLPPPLLEQLPVRVGIYYSKEFREYVHRETRASMDYSVNLGPAHVTNLDWLLSAMFREIVHVDDPAKIALITPPLTFVLEPRFEEYSFLTPKDVAGEAYIVTIRYQLTVYDSSGARVDSFAFTGYGREKAHALGNKEPLAVATQRAMRDAGAKVAVELTDQESVRLLLRGAGSPLPASPPQPPDTLKPPPEPFKPAQIPPDHGRQVARQPVAGRAGRIRRRRAGPDGTACRNPPPRSRRPSRRARAGRGLSQVRAGSEAGSAAAGLAAQSFRRGRRRRFARDVFVPLAGECHARGGDGLAIGKARAVDRLRDRAPREHELGVVHVARHDGDVRRQAGLRHQEAEHRLADHERAGLALILRMRPTGGR